MRDKKRAGEGCDRGRYKFGRNEESLFYSKAAGDAEIDDYNPGIAPGNTNLMAETAGGEITPYPGLFARMSLMVWPVFYVTK